MAKTADTTEPTGPTIGQIEAAMGAASNDHPRLRLNRPVEGIVATQSDVVLFFAEKAAESADAPPPDPAPASEA
jgi:hypothetical protein